MRRRLQSTLALAVVGLVATGCGGAGATPPPLTVTGAASTPTASIGARSTSTPSRGATSAAATTAVGTAADRKAASTVVAGFLGGLDAAAAAKSSAALKPFYAASCLWCADQTKSIDLAAFLGGSRTGGHVSGTTITYRGVGKEKQLVFDVTMSVSAMQVVDRNGHRQLTSPAVSHGAFTFGVVSSDGAWTVVDGSQGKTPL